MVTIASIIKNSKQKLYQIKLSLIKLKYNRKVESIGKNVLIEKNVDFQNGKKKKHKGIIIKNNVLIRANSTLIANPENKDSYIIMEDYSGINRNCYIEAIGGVHIGKYSILGPYVCIFSSNHVFKDAEKPVIFQGVESKQVIIEENVWIGAQATILAGVTIGKNAIIAAGSVVTKNIPPNTIAAGVPAKVIKKR